jgi:cytochrome c oxidase subunit IV
MNTAHSLSLKVYLAVFLALLALILTTLGVAFVDLGGNLNVVVALTIAVCKAVLVMLYFMHLRYSYPLTWMFAGAAIFWLMILIVLTLSDVLTRSGLSVTAG